MQRSEILLSDLSDPDPKLFVTVPIYLQIQSKFQSQIRGKAQMFKIRIRWKRN
jgi:hypothetical protein